MVPFTGAGASLCGREEITWRPGQFDWLPSGKALKYLAHMFDYEGRNEDDLVRVSQYVTLTVGAWPLYEELRRLFDSDYPPTALHRFLAETPGILRDQGRPRPYQLIVTTNYDATSWSAPSARSASRSTWSPTTPRASSRASSPTTTTTAPPPPSMSPTPTST